jgi:hypothetical protein
MLAVTMLLFVIFRTLVAGTRRAWDLECMYDIHTVAPLSHPSKRCSYTKMKTFLDCMDQKEMVINPDCGLKTRTWPAETIGALQNMVTATELVRKELILKA